MHQDTPSPVRPVEHSPIPIKRKKWLSPLIAVLVIGVLTISYLFVQNNKKNVLPTNPQNSSTTQSVEPGIFAFSDIPTTNSNTVGIASDDTSPESTESISLVIQNPVNFKKVLINYKFFPPHKIALMGGRNKVTISNVIFRLTSEEQPFLKSLDESGTTISSMGQLYNPEDQSMIIKIHLSDDLLTDKDSDYLSTYVNKKVLTFMYQMTKGIPPSDADAANAIFKKINDEATSQQLFSVNK